MKPILYSDTETAFDTNGLGILSDAMSAIVKQRLNGMYELTLKYPVSGIHSEQIKDWYIILAKPDPISEPQPFRIYRIVPASSGIIMVYARHIAYDLMGITVSPFIANSTADALQRMKGKAVVACPFSFYTDKTDDTVFKVEVPKSIWNILGGTEGSLLNIYGGEYEFDRYTIRLLTERGANRGVTIRYAKNLKTLEQDRSCYECYTGVHPYWKYSNEESTTLIQLPEKIVNVEGNFNYIRILALDLSTEWDEAPTEEQLRERTRRYIKDNDIGVPDISWTVSFAALEQSEEYKGLKLLESVYLGDTVTVVFPSLNINVSARAVEIEFDSILERYNDVTLGKVRNNFTDTIVKQQQEIDKKPSETVLDSVVTKLGESITGARGGCVRLLDTNGDGLPDELYIADNPDPNLAVKVWRYNYMGWAASSTGYNGPFEMGATLSDGLLADFVTAAKLVAGTIQSRDGETFFLDLDQGILRIKAVSSLKEEVDQNAVSTSQQITSATQECVKTGDFDAFKETLSTELAVMADKVAISVSESVKSELSPTDNQLQAQIDEIRMNYDWTVDGQYIGKKGADTVMRLVNDMMQILVSGIAATTVDKAGLTADEADIRTLHMGDYTWALGNDGHLMLT